MKIGESKTQLQRKPLVKRLFVGMAGSPLARSIEAVDVAESRTSPKRGRRPNGTRAMTSAERQKDCRLRKKIHQIMEEHHDYKRRLHDETSGGNSMSKITQIVAARDRKELYGGQKPVRGAAPDVFDKADPSLDLADASTETRYPRRVVRFAHNWELNESHKERLIDELARDVFDGDEAAHDSGSTLAPLFEVGQ
jgi:hypothetical protein